MSLFTSTKTHPVFTDLALAIVRIFVGLSMLTHGYPKLQQLLSGGKIEFFDFLGLGPQISLGLTVFAEFLCSLFLVIGLFTRWASFFLAFTMAIAAAVVHGGDPFEKMEMSLLYLSIYILLVALGPGKFSIDAMTQSKQTTSW